MVFSELNFPTKAMLKKDNDAILHDMLLIMIKSWLLGAVLKFARKLEKKR